MGQIWALLAKQESLPLSLTTSDPANEVTPAPVVEPAGEIGCWSGAQRHDQRRRCSRPAAEARSLGIAKHSALTASELSADITAVAKPVGFFRPPGITKFSASTESEFAKPPEEAGSSRFKASGVNGATAAAVVLSP